MDHQAFAQLLGNYGEFFGAIAVMVTLAYLAVQIRNQNIESKAATTHQVLENNALKMSQLLDPDLAEIYMSGLRDFDSLTETQRFQLIVYLMGSLRSFENVYYQWRAGRLDDDTLRAQTTVLKELKTTAAFEAAFGKRREHYRPEFAKYLDELEAIEYNYDGAWSHPVASE